MRVLMISYHWPPAGGITGLRALKLAKYLRRHGCEPVIHAFGGAFERTDESHLSDLPKGIEVLRTPAWQPYDLHHRLTGHPRGQEALGRHRAAGPLDGLARWLRANVFVPDAKAPWIRPAILRSLAYLRERPVDAIFSSGPPHTNTVIAGRLKEMTGLPWIADFQDPWTDLNYYSHLPLGALARRRHRWLERWALGLAERVTTVSPSWKRDLERLGGREVTELPWGFDEEDFTDIDDIFSADGPFRLTHAGTLGEDRVTGPLIEAASGLPVELHFAGDVGRQVAESSQVRVHGFLPRRRALALLRRSHALLLLVNEGEKQRGRIPAKLFEYLRIGRPILCLGDPQGDAAALIRQTGAGVVASPRCPDSIRDGIRRLVEGHALPRGHRHLAPWEVGQLAGRLAAMFRELRDR